MLPLRFARRWHIASLVLLVVVLLSALMPVFWFWDNRAGGIRWLENVDKWLHAVTFLILALWFCGMVRRQRYALMALGLFAFGGLIEGCQYLVGYRTADATDLAANAIGLVIGLSIGLIGVGGWCQRLEKRWLQEDPA